MASLVYDFDCKVHLAFVLLYIYFLIYINILTFNCRYIFISFLKVTSGCGLDVDDTYSFLLVGKDIYFMPVDDSVYKTCPLFDEFKLRKIELTQNKRYAQFCYCLWLRILNLTD